MKKLNKNQKKLLHEKLYKGHRLVTTILSFLALGLITLGIAASCSQAEKQQDAASTSQNTLAIKRSASNETTYPKGLYSFYSNSLENPINIPLQYSDSLLYSYWFDPSYDNYRTLYSIEPDNLTTMVINTADSVITQGQGGNIVYSYDYFVLCLTEPISKSDINLDETTYRTFDINTINSDQTYAYLTEYVTRFDNFLYPIEKSVINLSKFTYDLPIFQGSFYVGNTLYENKILSLTYFYDPTKIYFKNGGYNLIGFSVIEETIFGEYELVGRVTHYKFLDYYVEDINLPTISTLGGLLLNQDYHYEDISLDGSVNYMDNIFALIGSSFACWLSTFAISLAPGITLGVVVMVPVILAILVFTIKLYRGL